MVTAEIRQRRSGDPCDKVGCDGHLVVYCSRRNMGFRVSYLHCNRCCHKPPGNKRIVAIDAARGAVPRELDWRSVSAECRQRVALLKGVAGVFAFWSTNRPVFIGSSDDLGREIPEAFSSQLGSVTGSIFLVHAAVSSAADAAVMAAAAICVCRPELNRTFRDRLTIKLPMPEFGESVFVRCLG